jgi:hypothetical protein
MNSEHVDEAAIQEYALNKLNCSAIVIKHIESCGLCLAQAGLYEQMFSGLKQIPAPAFGFDLSSLVIRQLPKKKARLTADHFIAGFLIVFICFSVGLPILYFWPFIKNIFSGISVFFIYAILVSVSCILVFQILALYHQFRKKLQMLN